MALRLGRGPCRGRLPPDGWRLSAIVAMAKIQCNCDCRRSCSASFTTPFPHSTHTHPFHTLTHNPTHGPLLCFLGCVAHTPHSLFAVRRSTKCTFRDSSRAASNAIFRRKRAEEKPRRGTLTDRQHGWVFTLQLLCQSADLSIYINLLSAVIVVVPGSCF